MTTDWETALEDIDDMLDDERYEFAIDTLESIREWIAKDEHATDSQIDAIANIQNSKE